MNAISRKFANLGLKDARSITLVARRGVKANVFYAFADLIRYSEKNLANLLNIHPRTVSNYKEKNKQFSPIESEHLLKLIYLFAKGEQLFGTIEQFNSWLEQPYLNKKESALEWLETPGGVDLINEELDRLAYGYVA